MGRTRLLIMKTKSVGLQRLLEQSLVTRGWFTSCWQRTKTYHTYQVVSAGDRQKLAVVLLSVLCLTLPHNNIIVYRKNSYGTKSILSFVEILNFGVP